MTQTSSAIIVVVKPSMEYARLCMGDALDGVEAGGEGWEELLAALAAAGQPQEPDN